MSDPAFPAHAPIPPVEGRQRTRWGLAVGLAAVGMAFAIYLVGDVMLATAIRALDPGSYSRRYLEYTALGYQFLTLGVLASALLLVLGRYGVGPSALGYRFPGWRILALAALTVVPVLVASGLLQMLLNQILPGAPIHGNSQDVFPPRSLHVVPWERVLIGLFVAVQVPLTEETLFRGILYQGARTFFDRWLPYQGAVACAALLSGSMFALAHLADPRSINTLPIIILLGVVLAYAVELSRSVYSSMVIHGLNNGLAIVLVFSTVR